jgi:hypothetical protein
MTITVNALLTITACAGIGVLAGYFFGITQKNKLQKKIQHLESEMLSSHAEILKLSKALTEKEASQGKSLVVSMTEGVSSGLKKPNI